MKTYESQIKSLAIVELNHQRRNAVTRPSTFKSSIALVASDYNKTEDQVEHDILTKVKDVRNEQKKKLTKALAAWKNNR